jgi:hypothetical protein
LWDDWNNTNLYIRITDGAELYTISSLEIDIPAEEIETADESGNERESSPGSGGGISTILAFLVVVAIIVLSVLAAILAIRLRAVSEIEEEEEESVEEPGESSSSEIIDSAQEQLETYHVPDHTHLIGGGEYNQSTGHMAYVDPEGRWWWQQEDGSFYHDPALNATDATQDGLL